MLDLLLHIFGCYCLVSFLQHRLYSTEAFYLTLLIAMFKEQFIDVYYLKSEFSALDMTGNIIGSILGIYLGLRSNE